MTRISKQGHRRAISPRKHKRPAVKTGTKKDSISFKEHFNAVSGDESLSVYIPRIK